MGDVAKGGRTILFVSHNMGAIRNLCSRTLLIDKGKLVIDAESSCTIAKYLDQNLLEGAVAGEAQIQKRIEGKICRNNPFLHFKEIALLDEAGQARKSFNSDENIIVSVSFECLRQVEDIFVAIDIVDENAVHILSSQNIDDLKVTRSSRRLAPGVYNTSCVLPKDTFGGKSFFLTVHLVYPKTEHIFVNKILEFEVIFKGYNSEYGGHGDVFIRPQLPWTIRRECREQLSTRKM